MITDAFSKYTELSAIPDKSANTVARSFFECWICRHGVPHSIVSDREKDDAMMLCYNTHVQRATQESPFFLTYLHSPRLPYFNLESPRKLYGDD